LVWARPTKVRWNVESELLTSVVSKSSIFWDITPCSLFKVNRLATCFKLLSCLLYLSTLKIKANVPSKHQLTSNGLHGQVKSSQSHIATDGQSVSKSWYRAPSGATRCYIPEDITKNDNKKCASVRKKEREGEEVGMKECGLDTDS
jgi:hypothetical protein